MVFKNIRIKKKGGGSRLQRVQVLKSGKYKFVKNPKSQSKKLTKKTQKKGKRTMTKKRKRRKRQFTLPLAPILGLAAGLAKPAQLAMGGSWETAAYTALQNYTGVWAPTGGWNPEHMKKGLLPLVIGGLVHKFVGGAPLNINRMLASANVPVIRI